MGGFLMPQVKVLHPLGVTPWRHRARLMCYASPSWEETSLGDYMRKEQEDDAPQEVSWWSLLERHH